MDQQSEKLRSKINLRTACTTCGAHPCVCVGGIDPFIGQVVSDHFEIIELIGKGGMGSVYKARHEIIGKIVAVKILSGWLKDNSKAVIRFQREAKAACNLAHPNLVSVFGFGLLPNEAPFIVMDFVEGVSLAELLKKEGSIQPGRAARLFAQVSAGLAHAHAKGIVHRDLKPGNIMIVADEFGKEQVKIVDFGIAKIASDDLADQSVTETGEIFGSPLYMSPEQCSGSELDSRSDLYSLGCVMYEALTGTAPFSGANALQTIFKHTNDPTPSLLASLTDAPAELDSIIQKCLEKNPARRYQTASEVESDLALFSSSLLSNQRSSPSSGPSRPQMYAAVVGGNEKSRTFRFPVLFASIGASLVAGCVIAWLAIAPHAVQQQQQPAPIAPIETKLNEGDNAGADREHQRARELYAVGLKQDQNQDATDKFQEVLDIYAKFPPSMPDTEDLGTEADAYFWLGARSQDHAKSFACYQKAIAICKILGNRNSLVNDYSNLSDEYRYQQKYLEAEESQLQSIANIDKSDSQSLLIHKKLLAQIYVLMGDSHKAIEAFKDALRYKGKKESSIWEIEAHRAFGAFYKSLNRPADAIEQFERAVAVPVAPGDRDRAYVLKLQSSLKSEIEELKSIKESSQP